MALRSPNIDDLDLDQLLDKLDAEFEPIILRVECYHKFSIVNECFNNIAKQIEFKGGNMILGWQLWKSEYIIEAECHAVWEDKKGRLHDITPKSNQVKSILFVEDDSLKYEGFQIENIRVNITENELVDHFIETFKVKFRFENYGIRKGLYEMDFLKSLSSVESEKYSNLLLLQMGIQCMLDKGETINSKCFCDNQLSYKDCHGLDIAEKLKKLFP